MYGSPASTQTIQAVLNDTQEDFSLDLVGTLNLHFRECNSGEIKGLNQCEHCYPGTYSFSPSDFNCSYCMENAFCPGENALIVDPGYWRSAWNSSIILHCLFPLNCEGGHNSTCLAGFTGVLCHQCAQALAVSEL